MVHARGTAAHGYFQVIILYLLSPKRGEKTEEFCSLASDFDVQVYKSEAAVTKAHFLSDPALRTPVFVRFSTVMGSRCVHVLTSVAHHRLMYILNACRGSADTVRDVRGFATKFYTIEGNFDLVGNNIPVFFIQDAIKVRVNLLS